MNLAAFFLMLAAGVYSVAAAADEPLPSATQSPAAVAPVAPEAATDTSAAPLPGAPSSVGGEKSAPSASSSAGDAQPASGTAAAPAPKADKNEVANAGATDAEIKQMRSRGYKPVTRNGTMVFCRDESQIGSRFVRTRCSTLSDLKAAELSGKEFVNSIQQQGGAVPSKGP